MKFAITCSLYNRPAYTKITLEKLAQCELAEEIHLYVRIDPSKYSDTILELANAYPHKKTIIHNKTRLGCSLNIYSAIKDGFDAGYNAVIHIEDDIYFAKDTLRQFIKQAQKYENDQNIFSINGYNRDSEPKTHANLDDFFPANCSSWNCWGWLIFKRSWDLIKSKWSFGETKYGQSWDCNLKGCISDKNLKCIFPSISRVKNIGRESGTYITPDVFDKKHNVINFADDFIK